MAPRDQQQQRRRGVRASRARLSRALLDAGLQTQAALAERIADVEGLDSAPKDMVNRAFRELPVEPRSLERIAQVLGVPSYTLYKTADEAEAGPRPESGAAAADSGPRQGLPYGALLRGAAAAAAAVLALAVGIRLWDHDVADGSETVPADAPAWLTLGRPHLMVLPLEGDDAGLRRALRAALQDSFNVASETAIGLSARSDLPALARRLRLDVIVDGEVVRVGRLAAVRIYTYVDGVRRQAWAESGPSAVLASRLQSVAERSANAIGHAVGTARGPLPHFPPAAAQDDYLAGEWRLDQPSNELNVKRAETRFEAALRQDPGYAEAHAGLCRALLEEHWMFEEDRMLRGASRACGEAVRLDPEHPLVVAAHGRFLARTGRIREAVHLHRALTAREPMLAAAFEALAATLLEAYRQSGDAAELAEAKRAARTAAELDPLIWKPLFSLATMEWLEGHLEAAIAVSEQARARSENEYVLGNLGSFYACSGDFERARQAYLRARELAPASYVGDEFLGSVYYFLGDYERAIRLRRRAIAAIGEGAPEIHQMWGNLGDAYRSNGDVEAAVDAYLRAVEIAERDHLRGTAPAADRVARAYYYAVLRDLAPERVPAAVERELDGQLEELAAGLADPTAHRRMAQIWLLRGAPEKAREARDRAAAVCPGYTALPELAAL